MFRLASMCEKPICVGEERDDDDNDNDNDESESE